MSYARLRCDSGILVRSQDPSSDQVLLERDVASVTVESSKLRLRGDEIGQPLLCPPVQITAADGRSLIAVEDSTGKWHSYRGAIVLRSDRNRLRVANRLPIEDYLLGVLPAEMPAGFKEEALRAQAVAARTYAYRAIGKHQSAGFDVCDGSHCQLYFGVDGEKPTCTRAVQDTANLVLSDGDNLITTLYSADCGGRTRSGGASSSQLVSVLDAPADGGEDFCAAGSSHTWTAEVSLPRFLQAATRIAGARLSTVEELSLSGAEQDGRPQRLTVRGDERTIELPLDALRTSLGASVLRSPWITAVSLRGENVRFEGRGHGHGYGMCQIGANGMASPPHNRDFEEILAHYYPGAKLTAVDGLPQLARANGRRASASPKKELPPLTLFEP